MTWFKYKTNKKDIKLNDINFNISKSTRTRVFGEALNYVTIVVNNDEYEILKETGTEINFYGIKIENEEDIINVIDKVGENINLETPIDIINKNINEFFIFINNIVFLYIAIGQKCS